MGAQRVVLMSNRSLLIAGVRALLREQGGMDLSIVSLDDPAWPAALRRIAPHVIVLDIHDCPLGQGAVPRLLADHPNAKVVALNSQRKGINVFRVERVLETDLEGLLEAMRGRSAPHKESRQKKSQVSSTKGEGTMT